MNRSIKTILGVSALLLSAQAMSQITFYEGEGFRGRAFTTNRDVADFERVGFNDRASSVVVDRGRWEVCEDSRFGGHCMVLRQGAYDSLRRMGVNDRLSSVRKVSERGHYDNEASEPLAAPNYDYRRRSNERVYEARVTSVRAVVGEAEQRCWVEREQVEQGRGDRNVAGGIIGAVVGGVLGHQIGSGRGKDVATVGGAIAGAAIGSNQGRGSSSESYGRDVRRCETAASGPPQYWDVEYRFNNVDHRVQMSAPPGPTIYVNRDGEPRQ
jgi:uncharacterized protein YcfJ